MRTIAGERCSSQASATCCGDTPSRAATPSSAADALGRAPVDQGVVAPVRHVVQVLHGDDGRDGLRLGELGVRGLAEAEVADQALLLEFGQGTERLGDGLLAGAVRR